MPPPVVLLSGQPVHAPHSSSQSSSSARRRGATTPFAQTTTTTTRAGSDDGANAAAHAAADAVDASVAWLDWSAEYDARGGARAGLIPPRVHSIWDGDEVEPACNLSASSWQRFCAAHGCEYWPLPACDGYLRASGSDNDQSS